eukprot:6207900-Pleurochrysis_carterae.AAC.2
MLARTPRSRLDLKSKPSKRSGISASFVHDRSHLPDRGEYLAKTCYWNGVRRLKAAYTCEF